MSINSNGQSFYDIVEYQGVEYMISPSPSTQIMNSDEYDYFFKGRYMIAEGQMYFEELIGVNPKIKNAEYKDTIWEMEIPYEPVLLEGEYTLVKINESWKTQKMIEKTGVHLEEESTYYDEIKLKFNQGKVEYNFPNSSNMDQGIIRIDGYDYDIVDFKIFNDSGFVFYDYDKLNLDDYSQKFQVPVGIYSVLIKYGDFTKKYSDLNVTSENNLIIYLNESYDEVESYDCSTCGGFSSSSTMVNVSLVYGNNQILQNETSEINSFGINFRGGSENFIGNSSVFSLIPFLGGGYSLNFGHPDTTTLNGVAMKHKYYSYLTYSLGGAARLYLNRYKNANDARPFIEIGASYNLPLIFRQISRVDNIKISERWLHKFNDVSVYGTLGVVERFSLTASYRLFDVVKQNNAQLPKLQVGLSFDFKD
jgi:hypothetical protein